MEIFFPGFNYSREFFSSHIMVIKAVKPSDFAIEEENSLKLARENMPALPVD